PLTVSGKTNGEHGSVSIAGDSLSVTYTPTTGYTGTDQFTTTLSDGNGGTVTQTVYVTVYEAGQWASSVLNFSSQFDTTDWSAAQALGAPDPFAYGDSAP